MLNGIKAMINQKKSYQEAAEIILEDAGHNLDDLIVLGETKAEDIPTPEPEETPASDTPEEGKSDEPIPAEEGEGPAAEDDEEDILNSDAGGEEEKPEEKPEEGEGDDLLNSDANEETPLPLPGDDGLPDVVGKQTGEPPVSDPQNLMDVEVNMGTGTLKDVLPVPPKNADEALAGDSEGQHVDSGFGGEPAPAGEPAPEPAVPAEAGPETDPANPEAPVTAPMPEPEAEDILNGDAGDPKPEEDPTPAEESGDDDLLSEAISLGGEGEDPKPEGDQAAPAAEPEAAPAADPAAETPAGDDPSSDPTATDPAAPEAAPENDVTAAVKDKVAEAEAPTPTVDTGKEELMKKLSSITKSIEDAKSVVMRSAAIQ